LAHAREKPRLLGKPAAIVLDKRAPVSLALGRCRCIAEGDLDEAGYSTRYVRPNVGEIERGLAIVRAHCIERAREVGRGVDERAVEIEQDEIGFSHRGWPPHGRPAYS
jgi:hypothetical protein